jgi:putative phosphonate metabolism protein
VTRYAVYFAPPAGSALAEFGNAWLGRDPEGPPPRPRPAVPGFTAEALDAITAAPRRYGFHGTLKPPFALAHGTTRASLIAAIGDLAAGLSAVELPPLAVKLMGGFLALAPASECPALDRLASSCVRALDPFRRAPGADEVARRRAGGLTARQEALMRRWGYPYVLDEFRFHLTLTRALTADEAGRLKPALAGIVAPALAARAAIAELCVFEERAPAGDFQLTRRVALAGA